MKLWCNFEIILKSIMHPEIKISEGVYVTDFRKDGELKGLEQ